MATFVGSVITVLRFMFGTGALSMPYMFSLCGVEWGTALLLIFALNAIAMSTALISAAPSANSYEDAVRSCLGPCAEIFVAANICLGNASTVGVYLQIAGERLANAWNFWEVQGLVVNRVLVTAVCSVIVLPFTFAPILGATKWPSAFSCVVAVIAAAAIISVSIRNLTDFRPVADAGSLLQGAPLSCYAFSSMSAVFPVYAELPHALRHPHTIAQAMAIAACASGSVYLVVGIMASRRFGNVTEPDILSNFEVSNPTLFHCLGSLYAVACLLGIPVMLFPSRRSLNYLIFRGEDRVQGWMWAFESTLLMFTACVIAAFPGSFLIVLDLIGSFGAIAIDNVLPGVMFLRTQARRHTSNMCCSESESCSTELSYSLQGFSPRLSDALKSMGIICMLTVGLVFGIVSSAHSLAKALSH